MVYYRRFRGAEQDKAAAARADGRNGAVWAANDKAAAAHAGERNNSAWAAVENGAIEMEHRWNHFDEAGNAVMVDVTEKEITVRTAAARGRIQVSRPVFEAIAQGTAAKGDVLGVARVAGIMATKKTSELIPMCHPLMLTKAAVDFSLKEETGEIEAVCTVRLAGRTGVEMEALTGVTAALLTIYDMCKAMDRGMVLSDICLLEKSGGKSGHYERQGI